MNDIEQEFNDFEQTARTDDMGLRDYAEWLEEVISIAQTRLDAVNDDLLGR